MQFLQVFCWVYRHEGRRLKQELRCHAVLCPSEAKAAKLALALQERLQFALQVRAENPPFTFLYMTIFNDVSLEYSRSRDKVSLTTSASKQSSLFMLICRSSAETSWTAKRPDWALLIAFTMSRHFPGESSYSALEWITTGTDNAQFNHWRVRNLTLALSMVVDKVNQIYIVKISGFRDYSQNFEICTDTMPNYSLQYSQLHKCEE